MVSATVTMMTPSPASTEDAIGATVRAERERRGWSVAALAARAEVSRAMIAKIERGEANATAVVLGRLSGAFGLPLSQLIARAEGGPPRRHTTPADQPVWTDPETGYARRRLSPPAGTEMELLEITLPAGARVAYPAASVAFLDQQIWMLDGVLELEEPGRTVVLQAGDCVAFGEPCDRTYVNPGRATCRYLVAIRPR